MNERQFHIKETLKHKDKVEETMSMLVKEMNKRSKEHDNSKLGEFESQGFVEFTPKLRNSTYGSDEYKKFLEEMKPTLDHHYKNNRHHPEHFENGIKDMNLVDIMEMFCDWYAASKRHENGDVNKSIDINEKRFNMSEDLAKIFRNTVKDFKL